MSKTVKGTLFTVVAGIAWGLSGTSGQYLMAHGISALVLTNLRLIIAGLALVFLTYTTAKDKLLSFLKDRKSLLSLLLFALFGLFLNQFAYLSAIQETNAGTATVLQYVCPVGILIYTCIKDRVAPTLAEILSIGLAIGGTFLIATHGKLDQLSVTPVEVGKYFGDWCGHGYFWCRGYSLHRSFAGQYTDQFGFSLCICWHYHHRNGLCLHSFPKRS